MEGVGRSTLALTLTLTEIPLLGSWEAEEAAEVTEAGAEETDRVALSETEDRVAEGVDDTLTESCGDASAAIAPASKTSACRGAIVPEG